MFRLDYVSCVLTVSSAILLGQKRWQGWLVAGINSVLVCDIAINTSQTGFIPANLFCVALYTYNIVGWRKEIRSRRALDPLRPGPDLRASAVSPAPTKRMLVPRPPVAELRVRAVCCQRPTFALLDDPEHSLVEHPDLHNLLSCSINPQAAEPAATEQTALPCANRTPIP